MSIPRVGVLLVYKPKNNLKTFNYFDHQYLCVHQDASKLWGFPKGRWKKFETYTQGACRELLEETGIQISPNDLSINNMIHVKRGKHHHYYFIKEVYEKPIVNVDGYEIIDYQWMTLQELSMKNVSFFTDHVINRLITLNIEDSINYLSISSNISTLSSSRISNKFVSPI